MEILAAGFVFLATHVHGGWTVGVSTQSEVFSGGTLSAGPVAARIEVRLPVSRPQPAYWEGRLTATVWSF